MKLKRIGPGRYRSADGRVEIVREISQQTYRADEVCWGVTIDGTLMGMYFETKKEAVVMAERKLNQPKE